MELFFYTVLMGGPSAEGLFEEGGKEDLGEWRGV